VLKQVRARRLGEQVHVNAKLPEEENGGSKAVLQPASVRAMVRCMHARHLEVKASPKQKADWTPDENHN
jgi:hypothetical protein